MHIPYTGKLIAGFLIVFQISVYAFGGEGPCGSSWAAMQPTLVEQVQTADSSSWQPPSSVFSQTIGATLAASAAFMTAAQLVRTWLLGSDTTPMFTDTFALTALSDIVLTAGTHAATLKDNGVLKRLLDGSYFGRDHEFATRVGINTLLGVGVILLSWEITGIPINVNNSCAAVALCAAVYPVLVAEKKFLFQRWPLRADVALAERQAEALPDGMVALQEAARTRAAELGVPEEMGILLFISMLEGVVTSRPYEQGVAAVPELNRNRGVSRILGKIERLSDKISDCTDKKEESALQIKLSKQRRKLLNLLLTLLENPRTETLTAEAIREILFLGEPFGPETSVKLHRALRDRNKGHWFKILGASIVDQFFAVAIAGGVFLYGVNHYAQTGETPWYLAIPWEAMQSLAR